MIGILAALLLQPASPPPAVIVGIRLDPTSHCVEVWQAGELIAEFEPSDGEV